MVMTLGAFLELGKPNGGGDSSCRRGDAKSSALCDLHLGYAYVVGRRGGGGYVLWGDDSGWGSTGGTGTGDESEATGCACVADLVTADEDGLTGYACDDLGCGGWAYGNVGDLVAEDLGRRAYGVLGPSYTRECKPEEECDAEFTHHRILIQVVVAKTYIHSALVWLA